MSIQQLHLREYANGLIDSWDHDKSDSLSISVGLRLIKVIWRRLKKMTNIRMIQEFRKAIDDAICSFKSSTCRDRDMIAPEQRKSQACHEDICEIEGT